MAAPERGGRDQPERRRFITRAHVEDAAAAGQPIHVSGRDTVTDEAAQRAADLGVAIERASGGPSAARDRAEPAVAHPGPATATGSAVEATRDELRRVVRAAVVAEIGSEAPGLDVVIDRVLKSRSL